MFFNDAIIAIDRALKPAVFADDTVSPDQHGLMAGVAVTMGYIIAASDAVAGRPVKLKPCANGAAEQDLDPL